MGVERDARGRNIVLRGTLYGDTPSREVSLLTFSEFTNLWNLTVAAHRNNLPPHQRQQTYYGYSFESYCTSSSPHKSLLPGHAPGWGGDVDTNVQWCSVVKTKLADTRLVIGGEVDCVRGQCLVSSYSVAAKLMLRFLQKSIRLRRIRLLS